VATIGRGAHAKIRPRVSDAAPIRTRAGMGAPGEPPYGVLFFVIPRKEQAC
jgi:hypothetical protein